METIDTQPSPGTGDVADAPPWRIRFYREGDIPALVQLVSAAEEVDRFGRSTTEEELAANYNQPMSDPPRQVLLAEGPPTEGIGQGVPYGVARIVWIDDPNAGERIYQFGIVIHPASRSRGLEYVLASKLLDIARAHESEPGVEPRKSSRLLTGLRTEDTIMQAVCERMGLRAVRYGWTMERPLDEPLPEPRQVEGVTIRTYRRPDDNAAALDAYRRSFIDHFEFHDIPDETWNYRMDMPNSRPDLSWVAEVDGSPGEFVGFCIVDVNQGDNERRGVSEGWIELLGTVRGWRGKGLGKSLLLHGMRSLKEVGIRTALLGVDSESLTGANRLYESVGFTVRHTEVMYTGHLSETKM
jgi:mycothiol synthase